MDCRAGFPHDPEENPVEAGDFRCGRSYGQTWPTPYPYLAYGLPYSVHYVSLTDKLHTIIEYYLLDKDKGSGAGEAADTVLAAE